MKKCLYICVMVFLCGTFWGCMSETNQAQFFSGGFAELIDENGSIVPPKGLKWGDSPEEVSAAHGFELTDEIWLYRGGIPDENGVMPSPQAYMLKDGYYIDMFGHKAQMTYNFWQNELTLCWYRITFDQEDVLDAIDLAKELEKEAREALGDPPHVTDSIIKDVKSETDIWIKRKFGVTWTFSQEDGNTQYVIVEIHADDRGYDFFGVRERMFERVPDDVIVSLTVYTKVVPEYDSE